MLLILQWDKNIIVYIANHSNYYYFLTHQNEKDNYQYVKKLIKYSPIHLSQASERLKNNRSLVFITNLRNKKYENAFEKLIKSKQINSAFDDYKMYKLSSFNLSYHNILLFL